MVHCVMNVSVQSAVSPDYRAALERLVFFNPRQHHARDAIVDALDSYGALAIANGPDGLGVTVSMRPDAQCLFVMVPQRGRLDLAGGLVYLRTSRVELEILHIAIAARYCARPRVSLDLVKHLLRTVRATAHRLRGIERVTVPLSPRTIASPQAGSVHASNCVCRQHQTAIRSRRRRGGGSGVLANAR